MPELLVYSDWHGARGPFAQRSGSSASLSGRWMNRLTMFIP